MSVVEVLAPNTARLDHFEKFLFYQRLDRLEEHLLVSQDYRQVDVFRRSDRWQGVRYTKSEIPLQSIGLTVTVDEVYRRTHR